MTERQFSATVSMLSYSRFYAHYYIFSIREEQQKTRKGLELEDNYMIKQQTIVFKKSIYHRVREFVYCRGVKVVPQGRELGPFLFVFDQKIKMRR